MNDGAGNALLSGGEIPHLRPSFIFRRRTALWCGDLRDGRRNAARDRIGERCCTPAGTARAVKRVRLPRNSPGGFSGSVPPALPDLDEDSQTGTDQVRSGQVRPCPCREERIVRDISQCRTTRSRVPWRCEPPHGDSHSGPPSGRSPCSDPNAPSVPARTRRDMRGSCAGRNDIDLPAQRPPVWVQHRTGPPPEPALREYGASRSTGAPSI